MASVMDAAGWVLFLFGSAALVGGQFHFGFGDSVWLLVFSLQAMFAVFVIALGVAFRYMARLGEAQAETRAAA